MSLSTLIRKGGLVNHMTVTVATSATEKTSEAESVAKVASVAVATSFAPITSQQHLIEFVQHCCVGFSVSAQQVINLMLSIEDEQDIINGLTPIESLITAIGVWIANGSFHISGKNIIIKE
ncbi:hypothetical protein [Fluoribacter gormanii]|uniref:hypothetical protein n=1 Tax=Fluoribacter gormanii TaxID=464 RepID=UPI001040F42A|nr:hypothetical protein [Fluoribacter gormanii]